MKDLLTHIQETFKSNFDVKYRNISTEIGDLTLVFIDTLCNTVFISDYIIRPLELMGSDILSLTDIKNKVLNINMVNWIKDEEDAFLHILSGDILIISGKETRALYCEVKGYAKRGVGIPLTEQVIKGPREGFTEAFVDNVTLIRRRIKNPNLKVEPIYAGDKSNTVVCVVYIKGLAPESLINKVKDAVKNIHSSFVLDTNYVEEKLKSKSTAFDTMGYTEKPDTASARIMEGRVAIVVDGTPFVATAPHFFMENFQTADDYYLNKYFSNFTRIIRWIAFFLAILLPGFYLAITTYHFSLIPSLLIFRMAVSRAGVPFPTIVEVLLMMFFFQLIKEAGLRLPQPIGTAMSIVSALILGEASVGAGLASRITLVVVAISTVSYFLIPKLYTAASLWSLVILFFSSLMGLPGFYVGFVLLISHIASLDSCGYNYVFPIGTSKKFNFHDIFLRGNLEDISQSIFKEE
ncbi:spore germination protein [Clostridium polynesiense]|uniref:spore germination protein n=1 Tax=Clostridium polynesiense TaxID=1325933 RepID=UPI00058DFB51|nr:spore germination protein [Clostridium polynesiense]